MNHITNQSQRTMHCYHKRRGVAMMLVMVAILVTGGMALAYFGSRDNSIPISSNLETASRARAVADSGLELAITILETNADWRTGLVEGVLLGNYVLGDGLITVTLIDADTQLSPTAITNNVEITTTGTVNGLTQIIKATATVIDGGDGEVDIDLSEFGLFAKKEIEAAGGEVTIRQWPASPAFDSNYTIQVGVLEKKPLSVEVDLSSQSEDLLLYTIADASSMVSTDITNQNVFLDKPLFLKSPKAAKSGTNLLLGDGKPPKPQGNPPVIVAADAITGDLVLTGGNYILDDLELVDSVLQIQGDVIINVDKDMTLTNTDILLGDGATLTIYVKDAVQIESSYIGGQDQTLQGWIDPNRVKLYGSGKKDWLLAKDTLIKGEIYAPKSKVRMDDYATVAGRIAAEKIRLRDFATVLYDPILDNGGFADPYSGLYDANGDLIDAFKKAKNLSTGLIDAITNAIALTVTTTASWNAGPTARPNNVIYSVVVYGGDTLEWETVAVGVDPQKLIDQITVIRWWDRVASWRDLSATQQKAYTDAFMLLNTTEKISYLLELRTYLNSLSTTTVLY